MKSSKEEDLACKKKIPVEVIYYANLITANCHRKVEGEAGSYN